MIEAGSEFAETPGEAIGALVEAKLHPPPQRLGWVERPRLMARLDDCTEKLLTVVAAPAGYGKTTAVAQWLCKTDPSRLRIWVAPSAVDDDPVRLWTLIGTAMQRAGLPVAHDVAGFVANGADDPAGSVLPHLADAMAGAGHLTLVIDDFDRIRSPSCLDQVQTLIGMLPDNAHLVVIGRADPALRLGRLRAAGLVTEIRAAQLAFTSQETRELTVGQGLVLHDHSVEVLVQRCEGWPAGLYLAALSAAGRPDPEAFIQRFSGNDRYIGDYLVEEVLNQQSMEVRCFILTVSIVERFSADLCDHLIGKKRSTAILQTLQATNLFLIPLDASGGWFRFHNIFRIVAQGLLELEATEKVANLHIAAAEWFEQHGYVDEAVHHAIAGGQPADAARIAQRSWLRFYDAGLSATVTGWLNQLESAGAGDTGSFTVTAAWMSAVTGDKTRLLVLLSRLRCFDDTSPLDDGAHSVESVTAMIEGLFGYGGPADMLRASRRAVELEANPATPWHVMASTALGHAYYISGELPAAAHILTGIADLAHGPTVVRIQALAALSLVLSELGDDRRARDFAEESMGLVRHRSLNTMPAVSLAFTAVGTCQAQGGDLMAAMATFQDGLSVRRRIPGLNLWPLAHHLLAMGRVAATIKDWPQARRLIDEAAGILSPYDEGMDAMTGRIRAVRRLLPANGTGTEPRTGVTAQELKILRKLASPRSLREIGAELYVSHNTVKTHTQSLYRKLGARSRSDAVRIGRDRGLL